MYRIEVISHYEELWRYNILVTCGGYDSLGEKLYVVGNERITSKDFQRELIANPTPPDNFNPSLPLLVECVEADRIHVIIYVIAHMLPSDRVIEHSPPFPMSVKVFCNDKEIYAHIHEVNQWGGASLHINL